MNAALNHLFEGRKAEPKGLNVDQSEFKNKYEKWEKQVWYTCLVGPHGLSQFEAFEMLPDHPRPSLPAGI